MFFSSYFLHVWHRQDIIEALAEATEQGVIIVTCTQCSSGAVSDDHYADDDDDNDDDDDDGRHY